MWKYRILLLTVFAVASFKTSLQGQNVVKRYEKEIDLSEKSVINISAPESARITGKGRIDTRQVADKYIVSTKESLPHVFVIDKRLVIHSWEEKRLKQVVDVTLKCETEDQQKDLIEELSIDLKVNAAGVVHINGSLNIAEFKVDNGWFREDKNSVELKNGKEYPIIYLSLTSTLYVPKGSSLKLNGNGNFISLEEHDGDLEVSMIGGSLDAKKVGKVSGKLESVLAKVEELSHGELRIINSELRIKKVRELSLESSLSSINVVDVSNMQISNSVNDNFKLGRTDKLKVDKSLFSNYAIKSCSDGLNVELKNCDFSVGKLESALKYAIVKNEGAKIQIGLSELSTFSLICEDIQKSQFSIPIGFTIKAEDNTRKEFTVGEQPERASIHIDCVLCEVDLTKTM